MAQPNFRPGVSAVPATKVEISVSCRHLRDRDTFSKSDPMCVLSTKSIGRDGFFEIGRTEMVKDSLNPDFVKKFVMDYYFEESQKLKFELYDVDSPSSRLNAHDFLGRLECTLGEIVGAPGNKVDRKLTGLSKNAGNITVRAEEMANCKEVATLQFKGTKLDKKDFLGKSDPFLVISRANEDGSFTVIHKTEVIKNNLNPTWRPFSLKVRALCHGNHDRPIKFDCYDWDSDGGSHDFIGAFTTSLKDMHEGGKRYDLINPKKKAKKKGYKNSGVIDVTSCRIEQDNTFLDYVQGGMEINFTVAIDFTASNGDPRTPQSLHYNNPYQPNQYATALGSVGDIIQDYDTDKMFPALGFGAKLRTGEVTHEFYLNGNPSNPYCAGIQGVMQAYQMTLNSVQLWGPTNFSPCINHVAKFASAYQDGSHYFVLLILTDGVITDMPQTKEAIVKASSLPLSIIIVGVGDAEFDAMEELDADNHRLSAFGKYAERDIVQFVPFREFVGGRYGNSLEMSKAYLAKEVLAEVPDQVTSYMKARGIKPRPPQAAPTPGPAAQAGGAPPVTGQVPSSQGPPQGQGYPGQAPPNQNQGYPGQAPPPSYNQAAPPSYSGQTAPGQYGGQGPPTTAYGGNAPPSQPYGAPKGQAPQPPTRTVPPRSAPPPGGQVPYPGPGGQAPYPGPGGQAPYPGPGGQAPYPGPGGQAPYPGPGGQAPYPAPGGQAPYPGPGGQAAHPSAGGQAPYPAGGPPGQYGAPHPNANPQGGAPYPIAGYGQSGYGQMASAPPSSYKAP